MPAKNNKTAGKELEKSWKRGRIYLSLLLPFHGLSEHSTAMFNGRLQTLTQATQPCSIAYDCARIRRLVRLGPGLYRLRVADKSAIGFDRPTQSRRTSTQESFRLFAVAVRGTPSGVPDTLISGRSTRVQLPP